MHNTFLDNFEKNIREKFKTMFNEYYKNVGNKHNKRN